MNPEDRHKLALQIADQLNNDTLLAKDVSPWLLGATKTFLLDEDESLEQKVEQLEETIEEKDSEIKELEDSLKEKDKEIEKLEARITDLETQLTEC